MDSFKTNMRRNTQVFTQKTLPSSIYQKNNPSNLSTKSNFDSPSTSSPARQDLKTLTLPKGTTPAKLAVSDKPHKNSTKHKQSFSITSKPSKSPLRTSTDLSSPKTASHARNQSIGNFPKQAVESPLASSQPRDLLRHTNSAFLKSAETFKGKSAFQEFSKPSSSNSRMTGLVSSFVDTSEKIRREKTGSLLIPFNTALTEDLEGLRDVLEEPEKPENSKIIKENIEISKQLARDVKKCISELKEEVVSFGNNRLSMRSALQRSKLNFEYLESVESEQKICFTEKTPRSSDILDKRSPNNMEDHEINDMRLQIDMLTSKMHNSENKAKSHETENKKLREIIKNLERKLDYHKMYNENKSIGCSGNCQVF